MKLDFINNVVLPEWIEACDEEEIASVKNIAQTHGRYLKRATDHSYVVRRSIEISKSCRYENFTPIQKLIFISNIVFEDDDRFIQKINSYGWTKEKTDALNALILKIKLLQKRNCEINLDLSLIEEIKRIAFSWFEITNPAILINRLNELSVTKKEEIHYTKKY